MTETDTTHTMQSTSGAAPGASGRSPRLHVPRPHRQEVSDAARTASSFLPDRKRLLYYGGLGLLAAVEVVEWPVAVALGIGIEVARRTARPAATGPGMTALGSPAQPTSAGPGLADPSSTSADVLEGTSALGDAVPESATGGDDTPEPSAGPPATATKRTTRKRSAARQ
jgi:hypothetical protein